MNRADPFFLVWQHDGGVPTVKHQFSNQAEAEALRLAKLNPGKTFTVLQSIRSVFVAEPVTWTAHDDEVPF